MSTERSRTEYWRWESFPRWVKGQEHQSRDEGARPRKEKTESLKVLITPKVLVPRPSITQGHHPHLGHPLRAGGRRPCCVLWFFPLAGPGMAISVPGQCLGVTAFG